MSKNKIADSIIIRVGGGIREVPREPVEMAEGLETVGRQPDLEQPADVHPFGGELNGSSKIGSEIIAK